jgi:hypothetical protein
LNFFGAPASLSKANTATVSVQDKTDPNMNASGKLKNESSNLIISFRLNMMINALIKTEGKAKMKIWTACFLKMYQSELKAPSKMRGGKKMSRMPLGSISEIVMMDSPMTPRSVAKYPKATLIMKRVGVYGMKVNFFCTCLMMTAIVRPKNKKRSAKAYLETYPMII